MTTIAIPKREFKTVIKESVREVFAQETMKLRSLLISSVSLKEQRDIEKRYKKPSRDIDKSIEISL